VSGSAAIVLDAVSRCGRSRADRVERLWIDEGGRLQLEQECFSTTTCCGRSRGCRLPTRQPPAPRCRDGEIQEKTCEDGKTGAASTGWRRESLVHVALGLGLPVLSSDARGAGRRQCPAVMPGRDEGTVPPPALQHKSEISLSLHPASHIEILSPARATDELAPFPTGVRLCSHAGTRPISGKAQGPLPVAPARGLRHRAPYGATRTCAIAALLHDAAEDHGGKPRLVDIPAQLRKTVRRWSRSAPIRRHPEAAVGGQEENYVRHLPEASRGGLLVSRRTSSQTSARFCRITTSSGTTSTNASSARRPDAVVLQRAEQGPHGAPRR